MTVASVDLTKASRRRPIWRHPAVRILGSAAILGSLFVVLPFGDLVAALRRVPAHVWPVALATYLALHLIGVAKWRLLVNAAGAGLGITQAVRCYYGGLFGNTFLPSIVGGDVVRAGLAFPLVRSRSGLVLGSMIDRMLDIIGLATVAGVGALMSPLALSEDSRRVFWMLAAALGVGGLVAVASLTAIPVRRLRFRTRRRLVPVRRAIRSITSRPGVMLAAFSLGVALQSLLVVLNWWLGRVCGIDIPVYVWLFVWPLAKISGLLPVTQGGIGVREAAQAALFAPFGVSAVLAVAAGLVFEAVIIAGGLLGGGIAFLLGGLRPTPMQPDARSDRSLARS